MKKRITPYYLFIFVFCFTSIFFLSSQPLLGAENSTGIQIMEKEVLGKYLADSSGITLYTFKKDEKNRSNCIEGCAVNWPPFNLGPSAALAGCDSFEPGDDDPSYVIEIRKTEKALKISTYDLDYTSEIKVPITIRVKIEQPVYSIPAGKFAFDVSCNSMPERNQIMGTSVVTKENREIQR